MRLFLVGLSLLMAAANLFGFASIEWWLVFTPIAISVLLQVMVVVVAVAIALKSA